MLPSNVMQSFTMTYLSSNNIIFPCKWRHDWVDLSLRNVVTFILSCQTDEMAPYVTTVTHLALALFDNCSMSPLFNNDSNVCVN